MIDESVVQRIQDIYQSSTVQEQKLLRQILVEIADTGDSQTYKDIWLEDFKEVPVSIDQFIADPHYLGEVTDRGKKVYPFWKQTLHDIFVHGNKYNEIILSGATRIGKTSTSVTVMAYMLYRLMLYRDPHDYFDKKRISKFTIAFANLTKDLAAGVAFAEFNQTLKHSKWFMDHGTMNKGTVNPIYIPEGDCIEIVAGSSASNFLGMQIWACLVGDTEIFTVEGIRTLSYCAGKKQTVFQYMPGDNDAFLTPNVDIKLTKYVHDTIKVYTNSGAVIEGTYDHKLMLESGEFVELQHLKLGDVLKSTFSNIEFDNTINSIKKIYYKEPIPVYDVVDVRPNHTFIIHSNNTWIVSHNCMMDETNFARSGVKDITLAKEHMKNLYDTVSARISGTFKLGGEVYGKLIAASSKNTDSDFLSGHIETQQNAGNTSLYLVDQPQWKVLPPHMFSKRKFKFTVGDRYKKGFVIPPENDDEAHIQEYLSQGYKIMEAPEDMKKNFLADYDIALRDMAGISVVGAMGFITQESITPNLSEVRHNPFFTDTIQVGTQDVHTIEEFFHIDNVPPTLKSRLMNIHLDLSETSDRTGICGVCVDGNKIVTDFEGRRIEMPFFKEVFSVGVEAPKGDRLSFQKVVNFILWLRRQGFNIGTISTDQYQSSYLRELLSAQGFHTDKISVDASEEPYIGLKNILNDQRIELIRNDLRDTELVKLQRVNNKIDHPPKGCFVGSTKIWMADGSSKTIHELLLYHRTQKCEVYTVNEETGKIEIKRIKKAFHTKLADEVVHVILSNGEELTCTPDHRFMLHDGSYAQIHQIQPGTRLRSYSGEIYLQSIQYDKQPTHVYDLEIEDNHNFLLDAGVFVHNSKDIADALCGACFTLVKEHATAGPSPSRVSGAISAVNGARNRGPSGFNMFPGLNRYTRR
ncbi:MAG: hypothetical protein IJE78_04855 [Bacteroidaceae bacterium]|nr:hypothetical protein [Bacteroidaceae bacterium]